MASSQVVMFPAAEPAVPPAPSPVVAALLALDVNGLSPLDALTRLYELQRMAGKSAGQPVPPRVG
jgi:hypothetical protein